MKPQSLLLLIAGAAVLIVGSVVVTVVLLNRKTESVSTPVIAAVPKPTVDLSAPSPVVVAPLVSLPSSAAEKASSPNIPAISPATADATPAPVIKLAPEITAPPEVVVSKTAPDPRVLTFVDAIRVTGIRSSGGGSKVLMNDRVYRVNDIVERMLEIKLVKVDDDKLTFSDASGVIYTKNF